MRAIRPFFRTGPSPKIERTTHLKKICITVWSLSKGLGRRIARQVGAFLKVNVKFASQ
jgi:hypothetical protein